MPKTVPLWCGVGITGVLATAGYFVLPPVAQSSVYSLIGVMAGMAVVLGIRRHRPAARAAWNRLALGMLTFVVGDAAEAVWSALGHTVMVPSAFDAIYLAGYPLLISGVLGLRPRGSAAPHRESRVDATIVCTGALALCWPFLMSPYQHDPHLGLLGRIVAMAYPVMDIAVLFIVLHTLLFSARRRPSDLLVGASMSFMLTSDVILDVMSLHGGYRAGDLVDAGWLLSYVALAAAALHPSMADQAVASPEQDRRRWLPIAALAGFAAPGMLLVGSLLHAHLDVAVLSATTIVLFVLMVVRVAWLFERVNAQHEELQRTASVLRESLDAQQALRDDLAHLSFHDPLTGLPNRALLTDRITQALSMSRRQSTTAALCICDLDGFKTVNDSLGHQAGDELLVIAAKRLGSVVRLGDTVARLGGDEFAVLLVDIDDPAIVRSVTERLVAVMREPLVVAGRPVTISASVGVAFAGLDKTADQLLGDADAAMYEAKATGRDQTVIFRSEMRARVLERLELTNSFSRGLKEGEFFLNYQPEVAMPVGTLVGFEALVRWRHPSLGIVPPDRFIALAEETGFIVPLGRWILESACVEAAGWPLVHGTPATVAVNISGRQLQSASLVQDVRAALALSGLDPARLTLEITESVVMDRPAETRRVLRELRALGVRLAIDDFGTGYSSLSQLREFPVQILKIDKSFVDPLTDPRGEGSAFVRTILRLAAELGLDTVAEGVEELAQWRTLSIMGCTSAQGYLMSRPLDVAATRAFFATDHRVLDWQTEGAPLWAVP